MYIKVFLIITTVILLSGCDKSKKVYQIKTIKPFYTKIDSVPQSEDIKINKEAGPPLISPKTSFVKKGKTPKFVYHDEEPIPIKTVYPHYSEFTKKSGLKGIVVVYAEILEDGTVGAVEILKSIHPGPGGLDEEAIKAAKQWKFIPAKIHGKPIAVWKTIPIEFDF